MMHNESTLPQATLHRYACQEPANHCSNVSAVNEAPELTARSAQGFPRPFMIDTCHGLPWQGREAADALTRELSET
jgi:hypothetical protein